MVGTWHGNEPTSRIERTMPGPPVSSLDGLDVTWWRTTYFSTVNTVFCACVSKPRIRGSKVRWCESIPVPLLKFRRCLVTWYASSWTAWPFFQHSHRIIDPVGTIQLEHTCLASGKNRVKLEKSFQSIASSPVHLLDSPEWRRTTQPRTNETDRWSETKFEQKEKRPAVRIKMLGWCQNLYVSESLINSNLLTVKSFKCVNLTRHTHTCIIHKGKLRGKIGKVLQEQPNIYIYNIILKFQGKQPSP